MTVTLGLAPSWLQLALMHKVLLGDTEILSNYCVVASQCLSLGCMCKQNLHQLFITSISYHCVGVQVSDTQIMPCFLDSFLSR